MSLWRMKHTLPPVLEVGLVALVACYGFYAIYLASLHPFVAAIASPVRSVVADPPRAADQWRRVDDAARGLIYAVPPGWVSEEFVADGRVSRVKYAPTLRHLKGLLGVDGTGLQIDRIPLAPEWHIEGLAAQEFMSLQPALYDVTVDGRPGLFAVDFEQQRVHRQAVYVRDGETVVVLRGGSTDPATFATFVSTVKFVQPVP